MGTTRNLRTFSRIDLERDLRNAGIQPGDLLVVHSSLRAVGWVLGGPVELLRALFAVLGPGGTLVMPTFSFNLHAWGLAPFHPRETPSRVGALTEAFRHQPGVLRSVHPTHSVAAHGPLAAEIINGPLNYEPLGVGSPLDRVRKFGGRILLMGVGQVRNSTIHLAESLAAVPYFEVHFSGNDPYDEAWYVDSTGRRQLLIIEEMPGSSEGFEALEEPLRNMGIARTTRIGDAPSQLMESSALCRAVVPMLRHNPLLLLPGNSTSEITLRRRHHTERFLRDAPRIPELIENP